MKKKRKSRYILLVILLQLLLMVLPAKAADNQNGILSTKQIDEIELWIDKMMKEGKNPGVCVTIIKDGMLAYCKCFGYSDIKQKSPVTSKTLFELGSTSKAFTALGILKLEQEGKLSLEDSVKKFIPWFQMIYINEDNAHKEEQFADITIEQLLHHTSGIPFCSIVDIPIAEEDNALLETVKTLVNKELDAYPGTEFQYATINYDILGLIIQKVSNMSYEDYIYQNILAPLGMGNTYLFRSEALRVGELAKGYKYKYFSVDEYEAPIFRGNTPAGYIITCAEDMEKWLNFQLGNECLNTLNMDLLKNSHQSDYNLLPTENGFYAGGWYVLPDHGTEISHGGNNPNYSSFIAFRPDENIGIAILSNLNTSYTDCMGKGIMDILMERDVETIDSDMYKTMANFSFIILLFSVLELIFLFFLFMELLLQVCKKSAKYIGTMKSNIKTFVVIFLFEGGILYSLYKLPDILFGGLTWKFVEVWGPGSFLIVMKILSAAIIAFGIYIFFFNLFEKSMRYCIVVVTMLSILSGFGNSVVIFIINEALNRDTDFKKGILYFFVGLFLYIGGQKIVRSKVITMTNNLIYEKRVEIINNILHSQFQKFDSIDNSKIMTVLNNDTETVSNFVNLIISGVTSFITIICCLIYMSMINLNGLCFSLLLITVAAGLYYIVVRRTNSLWEQIRDIQNVFFQFIDQMLSGFKELTNHNKRREEFELDMVDSCKKYKEKRIIGDLNYSYVFILGELLFTFVVGFVVFLFPPFIDNVDTAELRTFVLVLLYVSGPMNNILNAIPQIIQIKISWNRIIALNEMFERNDKKKLYYEEREFVDNIKLNHVRYVYNGEEKGDFILGPVDLSFHAGETTFIVGGNGSGKTTLAKIITGLYVPKDGYIEVNGQKIDVDEVGHYISAIYSDYYLFQKLYGIDCIENKDKIKAYLKKLHLDNIVNVYDNSFSSIRLSSGQRRRLALLVSYLENRSVYLFDEWAADQDSEFRMLFYETLLPELKQKGKCVIALTHDDKYFDTADKVIKMERGKVVQIQHN